MQRTVLPYGYHGTLPIDIGNVNKPRGETMEEMKNVVVKLVPDTSEIDEVQETLAELNEALEKANRLLDQLANKEGISLQLNLVANRD